MPRHAPLVGMTHFLMAHMQPSEKGLGGYSACVSPGFGADHKNLVYVPGDASSAAVLPLRRARACLIVSNARRCA